MEPIFIELCGTPQGKGRPRFARATGHAFTPAKTRAFEADLKFQAQEVMAGRPPVDGPLECTVVALFPIPKSWSKKKQAAAMAGEIRPTTKPDVDNIMKAIDSFNQVVFVDDSQIVNASVMKLYSARPALQITIREAGK